ncbi:MAG: amino acid ABC transporter permease [Actinobacteria bacterium]|nr:amino acid ABC transporter permease [Actinomycetota bacterium]
MSLHFTFTNLASVDWSLLLHRIFSPEAPFLRALWTTVYISVIAQALGVALGTTSALAGLSRRRAVRLINQIYVLVIRGTPVIVQIFFMYFGVNLLFGFNVIPNEINLVGLVVPGAVIAGTLALAINEGAYMSEIVRAGIESVDEGQLESARAIGMPRRLAMRRIVLPQAARNIIPPLGNEFNNMIKTSSLVSFIGVYELFQDAAVHYSATFKPVEYFAAVSVWYLLLTTIWSAIQSYIEWRLSISDKTRRAGAYQSFSEWRARRKNEAVLPVDQVHA